MFVRKGEVSMKAREFGRSRSMVLLGASVMCLNAAVSAPAHAQPGPFEEIGGWRLVLRTDPITDRKAAYGMMLGEGGALAVKCDKPGPNSVYVMVISDVYLGASARGEGRSVITRADQNPPSETVWQYEKVSASLLRSDAIGRLLREIQAAERLQVRAETYEGRTVDLSFRVRGADQLIGRVVEACADPEVLAEEAGPLTVEAPILREVPQLPTTAKSAPGR
jgi:hypothetical protein